MELRQNFGPNEIRAAMALFADRVSPPTNDGSKRASVCVLLLGAHDPEILLIERAAHLRAHPGQWGLPGGREDVGETAVEAALRELDEELGLSLSEESVVGRLDYFLSRSGYLICPVVCHATSDLLLSPNPSEVAKVFSLRVSQLTEPDRFEHFEVMETKRTSVRMQVNGDFLYAPASAILYQFRELLLGRVVSVADYEQPVFAWS